MVDRSPFFMRVQNTAARREPRQRCQHLSRESDHRKRRPRTTSQTQCDVPSSQPTVVAELAQSFGEAVGGRKSWRLPLRRAKFPLQRVRTNDVSNERFCHLATALQGLYGGCHISKYIGTFRARIPWRDEVYLSDGSQQATGVDGFGLSAHRLCNSVVNVFVRR